MRSKSPLFCQEVVTTGLLKSLPQFFLKVTTKSFACLWSKGFSKKWSKVLLPYIYYAGSCENILLKNQLLGSCGSRNGHFRTLASHFANMPNKLNIIIARNSLIVIVRNSVLVYRINLLFSEKKYRFRGIWNSRILPWEGLEHP